MRLITLQSGATLLAALLAFSAAALGAEGEAKSCAAQAAEKKLAGAALKSFTTKCEADAKTACEKTSTDKKLAGAAKTSFEKKCLEDASGHSSGDAKSK